MLYFPLAHSSLTLALLLLHHPPPHQRGRVALPDMHVTDSSEAILSGRKPPFRLLVRALLPSGTRWEGRERKGSHILMGGREGTCRPIRNACRT